MKPLCIDLCCGLGGWARGFLDAGYDVIGFDVEPLPYPGQLVLQDVRTLDGWRFREARVIVASPPCQEFSRLDIPQTRRTANPNPDMSIVEACHRIAREAGVPLVLENVRGAKRFIRGECWRWGSQYLWGDGVPLLRPSLVPLRGGKKRGWKTARERAIIPYPLARYVADSHL
jgi:site-specific DNA-cytosine methylase